LATGVCGEGGKSLTATQHRDLPRGSEEKSAPLRLSEKKSTKKTDPKELMRNDFHKTPFWNKGRS